MIGTEKRKISQTNIINQRKSNNNNSSSSSSSSDEDYNTCNNKISTKTAITTNIIVSNYHWMSSSRALAASTAAPPASANNLQQQRLCRQQQQRKQVANIAASPSTVVCLRATRAAEEEEDAAQEVYERYRRREQSQQRQQQQAKRQRCNNSAPLNVWHVVLVLVMLGSSSSSTSTSTRSDRQLHTNTEAMTGTVPAPPQTDPNLHTIPQQPQSGSNPLSDTISNASSLLSVNNLLLETVSRPNHTFRSYSIVDSSAAAAFDEQLLLMAASSAASASEAQPIFDFGLTRNITGRTGQTEALIKCRVDMLNDKSVSWIRKRDLHILTVGTATYTSDKRFQVSESRDAREWTLHVKAPQTRDSGIYECQVNTEPKISMGFQLNIIENSPDSRAIISGPADLHFKVGSAIILNCVVQQPSMKDIGPIYWYRGEHMILFDVEHETAAGRTVSMALADGQNDALNAIASNEVAHEFASRIAIESQLGDTLKSRLRISNAQTTDTGNYTCQPTTASSASVMVHVINDENPAAMQKSAAVALRSWCTRGDSFAAIICCQPPLLLLPLPMLAADFVAGLRRTRETATAATTAAATAAAAAAAMLAASGSCVAVRLISTDIINDSVISAIVAMVAMLLIPTLFATSSIPR